MDIFGSKIQMIKYCKTKSHRNQFNSRSNHPLRMIYNPKSIKNPTRKTWSYLIGSTLSSQEILFSMSTYQEFPSQCLKTHQMSHFSLCRLNMQFQPFLARKFKYWKIWGIQLRHFIQRDVDFTSSFGWNFRFY